jgi:7,8-dihydropterin-6-yl-methyl-4-(beta-D-ribofuranosyl)aminobenzene 5'-phosphate synthase
VCATDGSPAAIAPRAVEGDAVDPVDLEPVDEVVVTTLVDNSYDALLTPAPGVARTSFGVASGEAPQFESGRTMLGLVAEQGFSALVTVRRGDRSSTVLFDAGLSPTGQRENATRLDVDWPSVQAVVLSHGHFDHSGGLAGISHRMPMVVHPGLWTRRRLAVPGGEPAELPTLSRSSLENEGFAVLERRHPSLLLDGCVLVTGEVDRVTEYERGMPPAHEALVDGAWQHDPLVLDDQALVVHVRDRGLVVLTGCGHAGAVNIARHALRLTGVDRLHGLLGGLHLGGPAFEPVIAPTLAALAELSPALLVPGHCTGWKAQHALAAAFPAAWVQGSVGSSYVVSAPTTGVGAAT